MENIETKDEVVEETENNTSNDQKENLIDNDTNNSSNEAVTEEVAEEKTKNTDDSNEKINAFDIVSLVSFGTGVLALILSIFGFGIFCFLVPIVTSIIGKKSLRFKKFANYGMLLGIFAVVIMLALFIFAK